MFLVMRTKLLLLLLLLCGLARALDAAETSGVMASMAPAATAAAAQAHPRIPDQADTSGTMAQFYGQKFSHGPGGEKLVALTFDDGPHPEHTAQVIQILKEAGGTANFFWVGEMVEKYPDTARMVAAAGFEIGSHSYTHPNLTKKDEATVIREIGGTQDLIEQTIGKRPHLFRPPGGSVNARVREVCRQQELAICMWSVDPRDWEPKATPDSIRRKIGEQIQPGAIVCMHDTKARTIEALPGILADLKEKGYTLTTIGHLLELAAQQKASGAPEGDADMTMGGEAAIEAPAAPVAIPLDQSGLGAP
jgi:peptidoglycan/xylan/chitin deacetylase (PgdA/CDA1 family)